MEARRGSYRGLKAQLTVCNPFTKNVLKGKQLSLVYTLHIYVFGFRTKEIHYQISIFIYWSFGFIFSGLTEIIYNSITKLNTLKLTLIKV